jgi:ubiquinone biosynthesis protein COQ4
MNIAPVTAPTRLHPLTAIRAVRALQADPEDTRQIFVIYRALRGKSGQRLFARFRATPNGQRILAEQRSLLGVLSDRTRLAALPGDSVGRAYLDFMDSENLSADGLVMASDGQYDEVPPEVHLFRTRMRDAHDLTHVLTGYGRDRLGELCLLAFMNRHSRNLGQMLIIAMSWRHLPKAARAAVREAYRNGGRARWLIDLDYEALLDRPLAEVRGELGIRAPQLYRDIAA